MPKSAPKTVFTFLILAYTALVTVAFVGFFLTGFFYYGFLHGDTRCFAPQSDFFTVPWDSAASGAVPDYYHDVTANFQVVCIWGFFDYLIAFCGAIYLLTCGNRSGYECKILLFFWCSHVPFFITMMVMRWRHAGGVCSGDYASDISRFALFDDNHKTYANSAGSFLWYAIMGQFLVIAAAIAGVSIMVGLKNYR